jgi:hypothetical protein
VESTAWIGWFETPVRTDDVSDVDGVLQPERWKRTEWRESSELRFGVQISSTKLASNLIFGYGTALVVQYFNRPSNHDILCVINTVTVPFAASTS